ncbi:unnamed protein product [Oikopleura dioica]|uniref:Uncharacterized protein n=1 Tax=Oikopleura dioica TaxID=34765 RepID=E4XKA8_OIKDI|nr:unnamed protein product [Oikopleura dioica]
MDWSFLANGILHIGMTNSEKRKIVIEILINKSLKSVFRNNEQFLSYRVDGDCGCLDCPMICFHALFSPTLASKNSVSIASHPSYGDVVKSKMISTGTNLKSFSSSVF